MKQISISLRNMESVCFCLFCYFDAAESNEWLMAATY